jgi:hypothetical protein
MTTITIDCDRCAMQGTGACDDCVVSFICNREADDALVLDFAEERALALLGGTGLVPPLRHCAAAGSATSQRRKPAPA